uniref:Uncharacterized protein n=1 Tax=Oryza nivara TaxID=4536 RepID=A0A0E0GRP2_ORYNI
MSGMVGSSAASIRMCRQVKCETCGKSTWAGCGRHVASVHSQIADGQHCACRAWPGVATAAGEKDLAVTAAAAAAETAGGKTTSAAAGEPRGPASRLAAHEELYGPSCATITCK